MTELYDGTEFQRESRRRRTWLTVWWVITALVIAANAGLYVYFCLQPYQWAGRTALFWIQIANVSVYGCLSLAFFALKYRRLRAYCKMLKNMNTGLKEVYTGEYIGTSLNIEVKEGVDFYVVLVMEYNPIKQIYFERKVLLDVEKEIPDFHEGEILHFVTQANMLMSYEVLPRPADEPAMAEKRRLMATKDKERLFDNVIIDEEALKNLKKKKKRRPAAPAPGTEENAEKQDGEDAGEKDASGEEHKI